MGWHRSLFRFHFHPFSFQLVFQHSMHPLACSPLHRAAFRRAFPYCTSLPSTSSPFLPSSIKSGNRFQSSSSSAMGRPLPTKPYRRKFGLIKVFMVAFISVMAGAKAAEKGAAFLEESEIFVHSEDDDD